MTIINVMVDDQRLEFSSMPVVASEGVKETYVKFALSSDWSGFGATALFYRDDSPEDVYTSVLDGAGLAEVPYEITAAPGWIRFGLSGSDGTSVHTSEILKYKVVKGKHTSGQSSEPPAPGIYEQMLAIAGQMRDTLNAAVIEQNAIIQGLVSDMDDLRSDMETEQTTFESVVTGQINTLVNNFAGSSRETILFEGSHAVNIGDEIDLVSDPTVYDYLDIVLNDGMVGTIIGPTQNSQWRVTGETVKSTGTSVTTYVIEGVLDVQSLCLRVSTACAIVDTGTASTRYDLGSGPIADESLRRYCLKVIGRKLTDDAEVLNIRVGADGVTYQTAGTAVRSQLDKKLNAPISGGTVDYGTSGQLLATDGQGNTEWVDSIISDGSITLAKLAPGVIDTTYQIQGAAASSVTVGQSLASKANAADVTAIDDRVSELQSDLNTVKSELFVVSDNLFDFDSVIENAVPGPIGSSPDTTVTLNGWKTSNYIPVEDGQQYALILNGAITTGAIFRVACYSNGIMTYKTSGGTEPNPFTIPSGVDHLRFFSNTASLFATRTATSFKKYSADMSLAWTPYGDSPKFASKEALTEFGVYVDGTDYYHFVRFGEKTLIRRFKREGPNNLFQFSALYTGEVNEHGVSINETIATNGTDTVGPISIMRQGVDSGGKWTGGWHTRTVNGVACPTAEQQSLDIKINGESIVGEDGLHYGECVATVVNKLYFPQTITGSDLSTATQAIQETVTYILNEKMTARVVHKYVADTRVTLYYGMQAVRIGFDNIILPNNETAFAFADMTANINLDKPEDLMQMSNNDWNYDLIMKPFGLAKYTHNSGAGSTKYGYLPTATRKVYWALMEGTYDYTFITSGKVLVWEGVWDIYPN